MKDSSPYLGIGRIIIYLKIIDVNAPTFLKLGEK